MKKEVVMLMLLASISHGAVAECSSNRTAKREPATDWLVEHASQLRDRAFKQSSYERKMKCTANRELRFSGFKGSVFRAHYKMQCGGTAWADAEVEVKPSVTHWTDENSYSGRFEYETLYVNGFSGVADLKDTTKSGILCFLPGGRIEYEDKVYEPIE